MRLWTGVFGEPPVVLASAAVLIAVLVAALPLAPPYIPRFLGQAGRKRGGVPAPEMDQAA